MRQHDVWGLGPVVLLLFVAGSLANDVNIAYVSSEPRAGSVSLLAALADPKVHTIVITSPKLVIGQEFAGQPIKLERNVTITARSGQDTVLDLSFVRAGVQLCGQCTLVFANVTVANERHGIGNGVDFVIGSPGSAVLLINAQRLRLACTEATDAAQSLQNSVRSTLLPGKNGLQQFGFADTTFMGHSYPNSLLLKDVTIDEPRINQEGWGAAGGYAVGHTNVLRLCRKTVDEGCLTKRSPDSCVSDLISDTVAEEAAAAAAASQQPSQPNTGLIAGVAVAGAVAVLAAVILGICWVRRRKLRQQDDLAGKASVEDLREAGLDRVLSKTDHGGGGYRDDDLGDSVLDVEALRMFDSFIEGCNFIRAPLGVRKGWEVVMTLTTSQMGPGAEKNIQLGEFLGAGSFGRVYKASHNGREVAVKVIEHNSDALSAVENEVSLMLRFNHENVVRAFYCVTYTQTCSSSGNGGPGSTDSHNIKPGPDVTGPSLDNSSGSSGNRHLVPSSAGGSGSIAPNVLSRLRSVTGAPLTPALKQELGAGPATASSDAATAAGAGAAGGAGYSGSGVLCTPEPSRPHRPLDRTNHDRADINISPSSRVPSVTQRQPSLTADGVKLRDQQGAAQQPRLKQQQQQQSPSGSFQYPPQGSSESGTGLAKNFIPSNMAVRGSVDSHGSGSSGDGINRIYKWMGNQQSPNVWNQQSVGGQSAGLPPAGPAGLAPPGSSKKNEKADRAETWLVQEFCDCGTLGSVVSDWNMADESDERMLKRLLLLQDAARGLKVLHSLNVVHGDLTARNVLVSSSSTAPYGLVAKLADLGLSRVIKMHKTHRTTNTVGTMSHMPPELLRYGHTSTAVDIYAFGVMMWELFTNQAAFNKLHYGQFFETVVLRNLRPMVPAGMPADYQLLMEHCWASDPAARPNVDRLLECLRFMIQERQQHLERTSGANAATRTNSAPLPAFSAQHLPRTGPGGYSSDTSQAAHYRGLGGMRPMQPGGFNRLLEHGSTATAAWGQGPVGVSDGKYAVTPAGGLGLGMPLQGIGERPGSGSERAGGIAAGFSAGSGGYGRSSVGDRSSIGISTPLSTLRPPLPLQHYKSGDYSQELPREESWFV